MSTLSASYQPNSRKLEIPAAEPFSARLVRLALEGLGPLYDSGCHLFNRQIDSGRLAPMTMARTLNYTATTLLGLLKARAHGQAVGIDIAATLDATVARMDQVGRPGELGLILWADALYEGRYSRRLSDALSQLRWAEMTEMELAWVLTGLCYAHRQGACSSVGARAAQQCYRAVMENFRAKACLFVHSRTDSATSWRHRVANFADQIYSVYALTTFYEVFGVEAALQAAQRCARRLCALQGPQGQWCWHYDSLHGTVVSRYPVYSVHQDGMAPMALLKLSLFGGEDFTPAVRRGLSWLTGANELDVQMIDWQRHIIWRDIERKSPASYLRYASAALTALGLEKPARSLEAVGGCYLNLEMRPYHLGWLLYALADQYPFDV